jgi:hypothetical protein
MTRLLAEPTVALVAESLRFILEFSLAGRAPDHGLSPIIRTLRDLAREAATVRHLFCFNNFYFLYKLYLISCQVRYGQRTIGVQRREVES